MQHIEFFHRDHFQNHYHRQKAKQSLSAFIDFFWETDFDQIHKLYPHGFSDALFPNVGYTYLINLGTPFTMQLEHEKFEMRSNGFLPRHKYMICHHSKGNKIFGIKFNVSPVVLEKKINFSEYREYIFPLSYLIDAGVIEKIKLAASFDKRVKIISDYYNNLLLQHSGSLKQATVVTSILQDCFAKNCFNTPIETLAASHGISTRSLQRYFEATTSIGSKQALQIMRIRKAIEQLASAPKTFDYRMYGYYDYSHFYKHLKEFLGGHSITIFKPHLLLLKQKAP